MVRLGVQAEPQLRGKMGTNQKDATSQKLAQAPLTLSLLAATKRPAWSFVAYWKKGWQCFQGQDVIVCPPLVKGQKEGLENAAWVWCALSFSHACLLTCRWLNIVSLASLSCA